MLLNTLLNSLIQIFVFALVPFLVWCLTARKRCSFPSYIGLKCIRARSRATFLLWLAGTALLFMALGALLLLRLQDVPTATDAFTGQGAKAIPAVVVYAVFHTALPEEILFRGFLLKRLQPMLGFPFANTVQAILFGILHGALFFRLVPVADALLILAFTAAIAYGMGYINEKQADGSVLPSWIIHALSNLFSGLCAAFSLL